MAHVYVFDPTATDELSRVRGIGRYLQLMREALPEATFTDSLRTLEQDAVLVNPFFNLTQSPRITKRYCKTQIAVIHDLIPLKYPKQFPLGIKGTINVFLNRSTIKNYDYIVTDSEASKKDIISMLRVSPDRVTVIYPPIPESFFESTNDAAIISKLKIENSKFTLYVGDATWNKNLVNIAKAVQKENITAVFVGKVFTTQELSHPWQREVREFMSIVKDDKRFIFPGFVSDEELRALYKHALCNLLVSRDEGFGFSYFEAAAQETPSVLANKPIFQETARDTAVFVNPDDPLDIAAGISRFAGDPKLRKSCGEAAYKRVKTFNLVSFKKQWETILH